MGALFAKLEAVLANVLLAVIVFLVFIAGVMRWFGLPLVWSVDLAQLLFVWVSFLGADMALRKRAHIGIDYLVRRLPGRARVVLDVLLALVCVAFLGTMAVLGYRLTLMNIERLFGDSGIPYAWVTIAVPAGCVLLGLTMIGQIVAALRSLRGESQPIFAADPRVEIEEIVP